MMSASEEIAQWICEQGEGFEFTTRDLRKQMPWCSSGAISGALFRFSAGDTCEQQPLIELLGVTVHGSYKYRVRNTDLDGWKFKSTPSHPVTRNVAKSRAGVKRRAFKNQPAKISKQRKQAVLTEFRKHKLIRSLSKDELWNELFRRDQH